MAKKYYLPSKVNSCLRRLLVEYRQSGEHELLEIISASKVYVNVSVAFDDWNGGMDGHDIKLFLPESIIHKIPLKNQEKITSRILDDIRTCLGKLDREYINQVVIEIEDETDHEYQQATHLSQKTLINPDSLEIWKPNCIRVFISHRDNFKAEAQELSDHLLDFGVSAFVAHSSIEPMEKWQKVILNGLETMEIMLAFVTKDFHESYWTNQEIGYAIARDIPIISLKLENQDPKGFIYETQAIKGSLDSVNSYISALYKVLSKKLENKSRMQTALIEAFVQSPNWDQTRSRFEMLKEHVTDLNDDELGRIINAFSVNNALYEAIYLTNHYERLQKYLRAATRKNYLVEHKKIYLEDDFDVLF